MKGEIIEVDYSKAQVAEFLPRKETGKYKQITVTANTKCIYESYNEQTFEDTATDTVENVFTKKMYSGTGMGPCFNFNFENGKCVLVYEVVTGH